MIDRLAGEQKEDYIRTLNTTAGYLSKPISDVPDFHVQACYFKEGCVWTY